MDRHEAWLVGSKGLYGGQVDGPWEQIGPYGFPVTSILRTKEKVVVGVHSGLWEASPE